MTQQTFYKIQILLHHIMAQPFSRIPKKLNHGHRQCHANEVKIQGSNVTPTSTFQAPSIERVARASSMDQSEIIVIAVTSLVFILFVVAVVLVYVYHQDGNCALLCTTPTNTSVTTQQSQICQVRTRDD